MYLVTTTAYNNDTIATITLPISTVVRSRSIGGFDASSSAAKIISANLTNVVSDSGVLVSLTFGCEAATAQGSTVRFPYDTIVCKTGTITTFSMLINSAGTGTLALYYKESS